MPHHHRITPRLLTPQILAKVFTQINTSLGRGKVRVFGGCGFFSTHGELTEGAGSLMLMFPLLLRLVVHNLRRRGTYPHKKQQLERPTPAKVKAHVHYYYKAL